MVKCEKCGAEISNKFCEECGAPAPLRQNAPSAAAPAAKQNHTGFDRASGHNNAGARPGSITSVAGWIGWILLVSFVPIIGAVVMYAAAKDKSAKNFAKVIIIIACVAGAVLFIRVMGLSLSTYDDS